MATDYADRVYIDIDGTVIECTEATWNTSKDKEPIKPMNRKNRATGYTGSSPDFELSLEIPLPEEGHPIDLEQIYLDDVLFTTTFVYKGGKARTFFDCAISEIETSGAQGEAVVQSLSVMALDMGVN